MLLSRDMETEIIDRLRTLVRKDHADKIEELLTTTKTDENELTLNLHTAASLGHVDCCKVLLEHGADVNGVEPVTSHGERYNGLRSSFSREKSIRIAWSKGHTAVGGTPLHRATESGHVACMAVLLQKGADVNAADGRGLTPLMLASMRRGTARIVRMLTFMIGCDVNKRDAHMPGRTAIHFAAYTGDPEILHIIIQAGADVNVNDELHNTPLHLACMPCPLSLSKWPSRQELQCVDLLIQNGAFINLFNLDGHTPLHYAASLGNADVVNKLLKHNAIIHSDVLLHTALVTKSSVILEKLLKNHSYENEDVLIGLLLSLIRSDMSQWLISSQCNEDLRHQLCKIIVKKLYGIDKAINQLNVDDLTNMLSPFDEHVLDKKFLSDIEHIGLLGLALKHRFFSIACMLYATACQPRLLPRILHDDDLSNIITHPFVRSWLLSDGVYPLKHLCRNKVRAIYRKEVTIVVHGSLEDFVELKELEEFIPCNGCITEKREQLLDLTYSNRQSAQAYMNYTLQLYR